MFFIDVVGWPPGQRRIHREDFGKEAQSRSPIVALFDTVPTEPMRGQSFRWEGDGRTSGVANVLGDRVNYKSKQRVSGQIRVLICVGLEMWHTARRPNLELAMAYADTYIKQNIERSSVQLPLLAEAV
jgi:hypothetical protein